MPSCRLEARVPERDLAHPFPIRSALLGFQHALPAGLLPHSHHHMECAVLMHGFRIVIVNRSSDSRAAIGNNAGDCYVFLLEEAEHMIVPGPEFVPRQEDPGKRAHPLRVECQVQGVCLASDPEVFAVQHEDPDPFWQTETRERSAVDPAILGALDTLPRAGSTQAPALAKPPERTAIQKIRLEPALIRGMSLLVGTERVSARKAVDAPLAILMCFAAPTPAAESLLFLGTCISKR
jgi:hypothetical protein